MVRPSSPRFRRRLPPAASGSRATVQPRLAGWGPREPRSPAGHAPPSPRSSTPPPGPPERPQAEDRPVTPSPTPAGANSHLHSSTLAATARSPGDSDFRLPPEAETLLLFLPATRTAPRAGPASFSAHAYSRTRVLAYRAGRQGRSAPARRRVRLGLWYCAAALLLSSQGGR